MYTVFNPICNMYFYAQLSRNPSWELLQYVPTQAVYASKVYYNKFNMQYVRLRTAIMFYSGSSCNTCRHLLIMHPKFIRINPMYNMYSYVLHLYFTCSNEQYVDLCSTIEKPLSGILAIRAGTHC
jgi:hypothetical protein